MKSAIRTQRGKETPPSSFTLPAGDISGRASSCLCSSTKGRGPYDVQVACEFVSIYSRRHAISQEASQFSTMVCRRGPWSLSPIAHSQILGEQKIVPALAPEQRGSGFGFWGAMFLARLSQCGLGRDGLRKWVARRIGDAVLVSSHGGK